MHTSPFLQLGLTALHRHGDEVSEEGADMLRQIIRRAPPPAPRMHIQHRQIEVQRQKVDALDLQHTSHANTAINSRILTPNAPNTAVNLGTSTPQGP
jgi:hypothetical protein